MKFYHIQDDYIRYLRQYDDKVAENKQESRPYVGVLLDVEGVKYYAPFTSPKPKHQKMKNTKDFRKINIDSFVLILLKFLERLPIYII